MFDGCIDHRAQLGVGLHRILHVVDQLLEAGIVDELLSKMRQQYRFEENVKGLAPALGVIARNRFYTPADQAFNIIRNAGGRFARRLRICAGTNATLFLQTGLGCSIKLGMDDRNQLTNTG